MTQLNQSLEIVVVALAISRREVGASLDDHERLADLQLSLVGQVRRTELLTPLGQHLDPSVQGVIVLLLLKLLDQLGLRHFHAVLLVGEVLVNFAGVDAGGHDLDQLLRGLLAQVLLLLVVRLDRGRIHEAARVHPRRDLGLWDFGWGRLLLWLLAGDNYAVGVRGVVRHAVLIYLAGGLGVGLLVFESGVQLHLVQLGYFVQIGVELGGHLVEEDGARVGDLGEVPQPRLLLHLDLLAVLESLEFEREERLQPLPLLLAQLLFELAWLACLLGRVIGVALGNFVLNELDLLVAGHDLELLY
uniref:Uncharacterized protein n=1 Tax=Strombidium rassoulzadegani TaxID=1082188 RepID=A0A7S3CJE9_9SPIT|mmetsp:Transcript_13142/g.22221  ORF Transcript_13142/g.22221 Transcript_13142/m.22221 type:complete len:302 (+) Transcript_13142:853-1758(+)